MCGGVRGVGTGGIVSTAFCLLYKLFTLKLTRKQVNGLITHPDSPYIRGLGFMYIRYTQPPPDLWDWFEAYLDDEEELDVKAGSGCVMTIGEMLRSFLTKLEWFSTLFPRIPVPIQKEVDAKLKLRPRKLSAKMTGKMAGEPEARLEASAYQRPRSPQRSLGTHCSPRQDGFDRELERERERQRREQDREREREREKERERERERERQRRDRELEREKQREREREEREKERERERALRDRRRNSRSRSRERNGERDKRRERGRNERRDNHSIERWRRSSSRERKWREDRRMRREQDERREQKHSRSRSRGTSRSLQAGRSHDETVLGDGKRGDRKGRESHSGSTEKQVKHGLSRSASVEHNRKPDQVRSVSRSCSLEKRSASLSPSQTPERPVRHEKVPDSLKRSGSSRTPSPLAIEKRNARYGDCRDKRSRSGSVEAKKMRSRSHENQEKEKKRLHRHSHEQSKKQSCSRSGSPSLERIDGEKRKKRSRSTEKHDKLKKHSHKRSHGKHGKSPEGQKKRKGNGEKHHKHGANLSSSDAEKKSSAPHSLRHGKCQDNRRGGALSPWGSEGRSRSGSPAPRADRSWSQGLDGE
uniref:pre-mRNA-splicing factor 38B-like isoform X1 n=3 Tax=Myxine glutinosa TaxID=7769 RepID=UPI00358F2C6B